MRESDYDIVIIGAGIHGAGIAQAAAARGYSTLLLEQYEGPARGTSSYSSKLIHGGLRYLESGEFHLVYECLRERRFLLKNAPDLVRLRDFYIPVYKGGRRPAWMIRMGLSLYALLSGFSHDNRFRIVPRAEWATLDGIEQDQLTHVFCYHDAQTHDGKLTAAVLDSAVLLGAELNYNSEFKRAIRSNVGYEIHYRYVDHEKTCTAGVLINAAGPWVNQVLARVEPPCERLPVSLVQGAHILLAGSVSKGIYYLEVPSDGRAVFVMPWTGDNGKSHVMIGTTETVYTGGPGQVSPQEQELDYLLEVFNSRFPDFFASGKATQSDIVESFAGLRVLPADKHNPFKRSREMRFAVDHPTEPKLLSIYGGKLTSYRATAEKVLQQLASQLPKRKRKADTARLHLNGSCCNGF